MNAPLRSEAIARTDAGQRPLKVLHLIDNLGVGGAETWLLELLHHWRSEGGLVETDILATGGRRGALDDEATALGATVHYLPFGRRSLPAFAGGFRRILREGRYQAIHDHQDHASGWHYAIGAGRLPPVRVTHVHNPAYQIRNNYGVTLGRRVTGRIGKQLVARHATHIVGTSREAITAFGFDDPAFARIPKAALYCGFDPRRFAASAEARGSVRSEFGWPAAAKVVLFAGRFDVSPDFEHPQNHKNSGFAVDVAIACARLDPAICFIFAGPFSEATPLLRQRIEAAGMGGRIAFAGVRRDIGRLMAASDALFFPSRAEGLGMVAVEAQAAGLPVLASTGVPRECVVVPELVRFLDVTGETSPWSAALLQTVDAPRCDAARANAAVAESGFSVQRSAAMLERLYRDGVL
jgi:glycosyltransferase involved in cell wall biosynthesis